MLLLLLLIAAMSSALNWNSFGLFKLEIYAKTNNTQVTKIAINKNNNSNTQTTTYDFYANSSQCVCVCVLHNNLLWSK